MSVYIRTITPAALIQKKKLLFCDVSEFLNQRLRIMYNRYVYIYARIILCTVKNRKVEG